MFYFPPYRFEGQTGSLWRSGLPVHLSRKAGELLECLLSSPGAFATHEAILQRVWGETHVQPENVKAVVHELRAVLGDHSHPPKFIRSEPGRGYTFVADVTVGMPPLFSDYQTGEEGHVVPRTAELDLLLRHMQAASDRCEPQLEIVEGDRGVGKTTLCDALARQVRRQRPVRIALGAGVEVWGAVDRYSVLTDALSLLTRQYPDLTQRALSQRAPGWLAKLSAVHALQPSAGAGDDPINEESLFREFAAVLDALTVEVPLLLILEDLQWSDRGTIGCLRFLTHGQLPGRVFIVATFCQAKGEPTAGHLAKLGRDLQTARSTSFVRLRPFSLTQLTEYLERRFGARVAQLLASPLYDAGGGNPQLAAMTLDSLARVGALHPTDAGWQLATPLDRVADVLSMSLSDGLQCQLDRLSLDDYKLLEAAATIGTDFTAESVAEALNVTSPMSLSRRLASLAERQMLVEASGPAPGLRAGSALTFRFRHPAISDLLLDRAPLKSSLHAAGPAELRRSPTRRRA